MPFGTLTADSISFEPRSTGEYHKSDVSFGDPVHKIVFYPATNTKAGTRRTAISYVVEKDVTVAGVTKRVPATVTVSINADQAFTATELDTYTARLSTIITAAIISRQMLGEV